MSKPVFDRPDLYQQLPWRDWARENLPTGGEGMVLEDLDLVVRRYGSLANGDPLGKISLVEIKTGGSVLGRSKAMTFGVMDAILRKGDPDGEHYEGYYMLRWNPPFYTINDDVELDEEGLRSFFLGEDGDWEPMDFSITV